jgi:hypothetical protein
MSTNESGGYPGTCCVPVSAGYWLGILDAKREEFALITVVIMAYVDEQNKHYCAYGYAMWPFTLGCALELE